MKGFLGVGKYLLGLFFVYQLLSTSCSRRIYPEQPSLNPRKDTNDNISRVDVNSPGELIFDTIGNDIIKKNNKRYFFFPGKGLHLDTCYVTPEDIVRTAQKYLGVPHCMGGTSMKCIDCSGLLMQVFARFNIQLPHNSQELSGYGDKIITKSELAPGDFVFFSRSYKSSHRITHTGIYVGNNKFIHSSSNYGVTITSLDDSYWKAKYVFGTRVLKKVKASKSNESYQTH